MYCRECGSQINDNAEICTHCGVRPLNGTNFCQSCGTATNEKQEICTNCGNKLVKQSSVPSVEDKPTGLLNVVACCFPLVGLILYLVWKDNKPKTASSVGKWALIGFIVGVVLYIIFFAFGIFTSIISSQYSS